MGLLQRTGQQFHWENRGYETFDAFLEILNSRKSKAIRKERREVAEAGVPLRPLGGGEIETRHWHAFCRFYRHTSDRQWGEAHLTPEFHTRIAAPQETGRPPSPERVMHSALLSEVP